MTIYDNFPRISNSNWLIMELSNWEGQCAPFVLSAESDFRGINRFSFNMSPWKPVLLVCKHHIKRMRTNQWVKPLHSTHSCCCNDNMPQSRSLDYIDVYFIIVWILVQQHLREALSQGTVSLRRFLNGNALVMGNSQL